MNHATTRTTTTLYFRGWIGLFALCLFMLLSVHTSYGKTPKDAVFVSGNWVGKAHFDAKGNFSSCTMRAVYESGTEIYFVVNEKSEWALGINNKDWDMKVGTDDIATIQIDQKPPTTGKAKVISPQGFYIIFNQKSTLLDEIKRGRHMIVYLKEVRKYELKGTRVALDALVECAENRIHIVRKDKDKPTGTTSAAKVTRKAQKPGRLKSKQDKDAGKKKRLELIQLIEKHLVKQGTIDFSFIKADKHPRGLDYDVMWTSPNKGWGGVKIINKNGKRTIDKIAGSIIAEDAGKCPGEFASVKTLVEQNDTARSITTVCRKARHAQEIQYYLYAEKGGSFVNIAQSTTINSVPNKFEGGPATPQISR